MVVVIPHGFIGNLARHGAGDEAGAGWIGMTAQAFGRAAKWMYTYSIVDELNGGVSQRRGSRYYHQHCHQYVLLRSKQPPPPPACCGRRGQVSKPWHVRRRDR